MSDSLCGLCLAWLFTSCTACTMQKQKHMPTSQGGSNSWFLGFLTLIYTMGKAIAAQQGSKDLVQLTLYVTSVELVQEPQDQSVPKLGSLST
jgi:hypothetical protein